MDAAMAHRERKQLNFSTIVDFSLSKQGIFFVTLRHVKSYIQVDFECSFYFYFIQCFPHVIVNMGNFLCRKRYA